jgi:hypothetical protein
MSRLKWLDISKVMVLSLFIGSFGLTSAHADKIKAIATISIIGDVVKNIAGDGVDLVVLVGPDGDAHEYEPIPADSVNIAHADIIFENGNIGWINCIRPAAQKLNVLLCPRGLPQEFLKIILRKLILMPGRMLLMLSFMPKMSVMRLRPLILLIKIYMNLMLRIISGNFEPLIHGSRPKLL